MEKVMKYTVLGTSQNVTACDCCGRFNLKFTIVLQDNETSEIKHFGSACGSKASGWASKELTSVAKSLQIEAEQRAYIIYRDAAKSISDESSARLNIFTEEAKEFGCKKVSELMPFYTGVYSFKKKCQ